MTTFPLSRISSTAGTLTAIGIFLSSSTLQGCGQVSSAAPFTEETLIDMGRDLFFNETFDGNGRTCGTCHREENNFTIDPAFIATLPDDDPLFVAEFNPELADLEKPALLREFGLILENQDGFDDLDNKFNLRGVPHTLAMPTSVESAQGPHTGWAGDGAPGDRTLRSFATGAVIQHFTKTLNRVAGVDFRMPTEIELDALEAFQLSLGRQEELELPLELKGTVANRGQAIFLDPNLGKCNICHFNAGANVDPVRFATDIADNRNFNTGVECLDDQPARLVPPDLPIDGGLGTDPVVGTDNCPEPHNGGFGDGTFNTPTLVEAADTGPFFHNNAIDTIEGAVAFYNGDAFNNSPAAGNLMADDGSVGIHLDATQVVEVAAFLRVINALENIRQSIDLISRSRQSTGGKSGRLLTRAIAEIDDSIDVLRGGGLHPKAVMYLQDAKRITQCSADGGPSCAHRGNTDAITQLQNARSQMAD